MHYETVADAIKLDGLRLVLTAGVPGPWGEAAKAVFKVKGIPYVPVLQKPAQANEDLVAWTGHRNAPTAMYRDEPPRASWLDIVNLAERLQPLPALVPGDIDDRILVYGLTNELAGESGMLWNMRQLMFRALREAHGEEAVAKNPMIRDYRCTDSEATGAATKIIQILRRIELQLQRQADAGRRYLVGQELSALDLYWACFSHPLDPLPANVNPMPDTLRAMWRSGADALAAEGYSPDALGAKHREFIFREHIGLPLDF